MIDKMTDLNCIGYETAIKALSRKLNEVIDKVNELDKEKHIRCPRCGMSIDVEEEPAMHGFAYDYSDIGCNCHLYVHGGLTNGWICPVHGQQW